MMINRRFYGIIIKTLLLSKGTPSDSNTHFVTNDNSDYEASFFILVYNKDGRRLSHESYDRIAREGRCRCYV